MWPLLTAVCTMHRTKWVLGHATDDCQRLRVLMQLIVAGTAWTRSVAARCTAQVLPKGWREFERLNPTMKIRIFDKDFRN